MNKEKNNKDLIDMEVILPFMRKYWPVLAICSILGLSLAFFINKVSQPVYQVGASLLVKSSQNQSVQAISKVFEGMGMVAG